MRLNMSFCGTSYRRNKLSSQTKSNICCRLQVVLAGAGLALPFSVSFLVEYCLKVTVDVGGD